MDRAARSSTNKTPLYSSLSEQLVEWSQSSDVDSLISSAADVAHRSIAVLNREREVRREELNRPITV